MNAFSTSWSGGARGSRSEVDRIAGSVFVPRQAISLADIYTDALYLALDIQRGRRIEDPRRFREQVLRQLDATAGVGLVAEYSEEEMSLAQYAVAAYVDEAVLNSDNSLREYWQTRPLQLELYNDNRGGEGFFGRLDALRQAPERNYRLLELYNLCLMLGFEGRYRMEGPETLRSISAGVAQEVSRLRGQKATQLAPHAVLRERRRTFRLSVSVWLWPLLVLLGLWYVERWFDQRLRAGSTALSQSATVLATTPAAFRRDMQSVLDAMLMGKTIAFESGRDVLTAQGATFLNTLVPALQSEPGARVLVSGHTDDLGQPASNQRLSLARAQAVVNFLVDRGIRAERLHVEGFGAEHPVADNGTREGQALNRRIEFKVMN